METQAAVYVADVDAAYRVWQRSHSGSRASFLRFMSRPSGERARFLEEAHAAPEAAKGFVFVKV